MVMTLSCPVKVFNDMRNTSHLRPIFMVLRMVTRGHCQHSLVMRQAGGTMWKLRKRVN